MVGDEFFQDYDTAPRATKKKSSASSLEGSFLGTLKAWQRFILSVFVFLDVAIIGLLFLVMLGRMSFG